VEILLIQKDVDEREESGDQSDHDEEHELELVTLLREAVT
tara:strand:+ start:698 stop:817 length:120 start_codon:yes stop_codon:yes gene_type:complete